MPARRVVTVSAFRGGGRCAVVLARDVGPDILHGEPRLHYTAGDAACWRRPRSMHSKHGRAALCYIDALLCSHRGCMLSSRLPPTLTTSLHLRACAAKHRSFPNGPLCPQVAGFLLWKTPLYTTIDFISGFGASVPARLAHLTAACPFRSMHAVDACRAPPPSCGNTCVLPTG